MSCTNTAFRCLKDSRSTNLPIICSCPIASSLPLICASIPEVPVSSPQFQSLTTNLCPFPRVLFPSQWFWPLPPQFSTILARFFPTFSVLSHTYCPFSMHSSTPFLTVTVLQFMSLSHSSCHLYRTPFLSLLLKFSPATSIPAHSAVLVLPPQFLCLLHSAYSFPTTPFLSP